MKTPLSIGLFLISISVQARAPDQSPLVTAFTPFAVAQRGPLSLLQAFADTKTNDWGAMTNSIQMSIALRPEKTDFRLSNVVVLVIRLRNLSDHETFLVSRWNAIENDPSYSFVVTSPSGKDVSPGPKIIPGSAGATPLEPNKTLEFEFNLSRLCKFDEVGEYRITAKKLVRSPAREMSFAVISNLLNISITAARN